MTPSEMRAKTIVDRIGIVRSMLDNLRKVPLGSLEEFTSDPLNAPANAKSRIPKLLCQIAGNPPQSTQQQPRADKSEIRNPKSEIPCE